MGISERNVWENVFCELKKAKKISILEASRKQLVEAKKLSESRNVPFNDSLFAVIARDEEVILISRDKHYLEDLSDLAETLAPEDLG